MYNDYLFYSHNIYTDLKTIEQITLFQTLIITFSCMLNIKGMITKNKQNKKQTKKYTTPEGFYAVLAY